MEFNFQLKNWNIFSVHLHPYTFTFRGRFRIIFIKLKISGLSNTSVAQSASIRY